MIVKFRLRPAHRVQRKRGKNKHLALAFAALLWPAVFTAYVLGFWGVGADLGLTGGFAFSQGVFSHWQVWLALAVCLNLASIVLNRYGQQPGELRFRESVDDLLTGFSRPER
jgi:hypothetical protein